MKIDDYLEERLEELREERNEIIDKDEAKYKRTRNGGRIVELQSLKNQIEHGDIKLQ